MSFNIFASGGSGFHYSFDGFVDGSGFEWIKVVSALSSMSPKVPTVVSVGSDVITAGADYLKPDMSDAVERIANYEMLHNLNNVVSFLAMCTGSANGWISVSCTNSHGWLWPPTKSFARYNFTPGDSPGAELVRLIGPGLKETKMNNWGVLLALSVVLGKYSNAIGQDATPIINIMMDH